MDKASQPESKDLSTLERHGLFLPDTDIFEIDLVQKAKDIWDGRRLIMIFIASFLVFGYFHTKYGPTEYTSTSALIQESEGASVGDFGSSFLRSLTGLNIQSGGSGNMSAVATGRAPLPVTLYPRIISSTEFQKELIYTEFEFSNLDSTMTLINYHQNFNEPPLRDKVYSLAGNMTIFLPFQIYDWGKGLIRSAWRTISGVFVSEESSDNESQDNEQMVDVISDDRLQNVSKEESAVMTWLTPRITLTSSGGVMEVATTLPDPKAAALVNAMLIEYIQEYITEYRVEKATQNLEATLERYELAKERYEEAQTALAEYRDQNINITTESAQIREQRLSNEASLRFNIYNSISQEVEQARMIRQQQIPVFNTLEKPNVPSAPSTGTSPLLMVFSGVLGLFFGVGIVLVRSFFGSSQ